MFPGKTKKQTKKKNRFSYIIKVLFTSNHDCNFISSAENICTCLLEYTLKMEEASQNCIKSSMNVLLNQEKCINISSTILINDLYFMDKWMNSGYKLLI